MAWPLPCASARATCGRAWSSAEESVLRASPVWSHILEGQEFELDQHVENLSVPHVRPDNHGEIRIAALNLRFGIHYIKDVVIEQGQKSGLDSQLVGPGRSPGF